MPKIQKFRDSSVTSSSPLNHEEVKCLKCFICNRVIRIEKLSEHLIFGEVDCAKCFVSFRDCHSFQTQRAERRLGNESCEHLLHYSRDPLQSLQIHLSNQYLENGSTHKATLMKASLIDQPGHLKAYVRGMKLLSDEFPWQEAVEVFKDHTAKLKQKNGKKVVVTNKKSESAYQSNTKQEEAINGISPVCNGDDVLRNKDEVSVNGFNTPYSNGKVNGLNAPYSNGKVTEPVVKDSPTVNVPPLCDKVDTGTLCKKKKPEIKKKRKTEWISGTTKKKSHNPKERPVDYVETPIDGFYYIVRHAITECPNCYAHISPPDFTVNIVTFLMTAVCHDCSLTIYIVHDPPDDSAPRVCIVTAEAKRNSLKKSPLKGQQNGIIIS